VVELIYLSIDTLGGYLDNPNHNLLRSMDPPQPPPVGDDLAVAAQMRIMQQMADTMVDMHAQMRQERQKMRQDREDIRQEMRQEREEIRQERREQQQ
jgi:hypothetical protein